jgi:hypothetical protein
MFFKTTSTGVFPDIPFSSPEFSQDLCSLESSPQYLDNAFPSLEISIPEDQGTLFQAGDSKEVQKSLRDQQWVFLDQEGVISYSEGGEMKE